MIDFNMLIPIKLTLALILAVLNVLVMAVPFFSAVLLKVAIPGQAPRRYFTGWVTNCARQYNRNNALIFRIMGSIDWQVRGVEDLRRDGSYLVVCNHQSWADIPVLQHVLEQRIPLLKFFLKKELIRIPILGAAWWALDFPFMKRYSREFLEKHPEKRGEDVIETRKMCERFKGAPVSVMNFLEGTRYTREKSQAQNSPYKHLLKPKAGGAALVINSMGDTIKTMVDVTLDYKVEGEMSIWKLISGQVESICLEVQLIDIPGYFVLSDYENDLAFRQEIQDWVGTIWARKDARLEAGVFTAG